MTQPVEVLPAEVQQPIQVLTAKDLRDRILQESGLTAEEFQELRRTVRLPGGWQVQATVPLPEFQTHVIFALFHGKNGDLTGDFVPGDVRCYAQPKVFTDPDGEEIPWLRFVLNRSSGFGVRTDAMPMKAWIDDVSHEFGSSIVDVEDPEDDEDEEGDESEDATCTVCSASHELDARFCQNCGNAVRRCEGCNTIMTAFQKFCADCGKGTLPEVVVASQLPT